CMPGCLLDRQGHTEGAIALAQLADLHPVVAICELMNEEGHMARGEEVVEFAEKHGIPRISVQALVERVC
ncbi:MAG: 3,4-dihydroxy-2-butanone-4-phosphate synthase, partial [Armatimonadota bacterium]